MRLSSRSEKRKKRESKEVEKKKGKEVAEETKVKKKGKEVAEEPRVEMFNPLADLDDILDGIEKTYALTGNSMIPGEKRQTTGLLSLDLVLGGGITAGWYTNFGAEQSCKSTLAMTILCSCIDSNIPSKAYFDYEGCLVGDSIITTEEGSIKLNSLFSSFSIDSYIPVKNIFVKTVGSELAEVEGITYKGPKPITRIETSCSKELKGFRHPILALTAEGNLDWIFLEDLKVGDMVVTEK